MTNCYTFNCYHLFVTAGEKAGENLADVELKFLLFHAKNSTLLGTFSSDNKNYK